MGSPNRVKIHGFSYHNENDFVTFKGDNKPKYEVSNIIDKLTGKRIYSYEENFKPNFGTRVFLHIKDSEYIQLQCGGGA